MEGPQKSNPLALQLFSAVSQSTWKFAWLRPKVLMALRRHTDEQEAAFTGRELEAGREDMETRPLWATRTREDSEWLVQFLQLPFYR